MINMHLTKQTFQMGSGDVLNESLKRSGGLLKVKTGAFIISKEKREVD